MHPLPKPKLYKGKNTKTVHARVTHEMEQAIEQLASALSIKASEVVRHAIESTLAKAIAERLITGPDDSSSSDPQ